MKCYHKFLLLDGSCRDCQEIIFTPTEDSIMNNDKITFEEFHKELKELLNKAGENNISMDRINVSNHFTMDGTSRVTFIEIDGLNYAK